MLLCAARFYFFPSVCVKPIDWFCLLLHPTLMLSLIVLICPQTQRLEELRRTSGLLWPSRCTCSVAPQIPEPNRNSAAWPVGAWQPDNGAPPFCFFFFFLTHWGWCICDWFFFFFCLLLSPTTFRCSALSSTESRLDQCIVFLSQSHSNEPKTRKVMQVRFGREEEQSFWKPPSGSYEFLWV